MLLGPLRRSFKRHGAYLLKLPDTAVGPGSLLLRDGALFQSLSEVDALWGGFKPTSRRFDARFLVDQVVFSVAGGGQVGLGLPRSASVAALVESSRMVTISIEGITLRRLGHGDNVHEIQEAADWIARINANLGNSEIQPAIDLMQRRVSGWPVPRAVDLVEAVVHVDRITFSSDSESRVAVEAAVDEVLPVDIDAGVDVAWSRAAQLQWGTAQIPIAYLPVRYAWGPLRKQFVPALI